MVQLNKRMRQDDVKTEQPTLEASSGERRLSFLFDSLRDVEDQLDGALLVIRGKPETLIPKAARSVDAAAVHISSDHTPYGVRRDDRVRIRC